MENQQTAVEWLWNSLKSSEKKVRVWDKLLNDAKELEAKQAQEYAEFAKWMPKPFNTIEFLPELANEYYNKTYVGKL